MSWTDAAGLTGVILMLIAYGGSALGKIDATRAVALTVNLIGAGLILLSLYYDFNLSAVAMEGSWALISVIGLARLVIKRRAADRAPAE